MKHRVTLTDEELEALSGRLVPITPTDYDLKTYALLRSLYGRFLWLINTPKATYRRATQEILGAAAPKERRAR